MDLGKSYVNGTEMVAAVTAGGVYGPGELYRFDGTGWRQIGLREDHRSRSRRSRCVTFDTSRPGLYRYVGIAVSNHHVADGYFERAEDGEIIGLNDQQTEARQLALYPEYAVILEAERLNRGRDTALAIERLQRALDARRELIAREAAIDPTNLEDLPRLTGSRRQVRWANIIRADWAAKTPNLPELKTETTAKWWIEHRHRWLD